MPPVTVDMVLGNIITIIVILKENFALTQSITYAISCNVVQSEQIQISFYYYMSATLIQLYTSIFCPLLYFLLFFLFFLSFLLPFLSLCNLLSTSIVHSCTHGSYLYNIFLSYHSPRLLLAVPLRGFLSTF